MKTTKSENLPGFAEGSGPSKDLSGGVSRGGRKAMVTGTGGLGLATALDLARAGWEVIIAGRSAGKGDDAVETILHEVPSSSVRFEKVDLADLGSVADFTRRFARETGSLDLLVNNAGVMTPPTRMKTSDGFELQFGTNYLGHFALTAGLMPLLSKGNEARVVTVSSLAARGGKIDFENLNAERSYKPMVAYGQSKLACLMFALELQRRSDAEGWGIESMAAHPGITRTDLLHNGPGRRSLAGLARTFLWFLFQPVARGALSQLYAATSPVARGGFYYGPSGLAGMRGEPARVAIPRQALELKDASRLWEMSEQWAGATFSADSANDQPGNRP